MGAHRHDQQHVGVDSDGRGLGGYCDAKKPWDGRCHGRLRDVAEGDVVKPEAGVVEGQDTRGKVAGERGDYGVCMQSEDLAVATKICCWDC